MIGTTLGHFKVIAKLSESASGAEYRAEDEALRRHVALKILSPTLGSDPDRKARFLKAARAAALVTHPHVAALHEVGETGGHVWVAMELVEGSTLRRRLTGRPLPVLETLRIGEQVAEGLAAAHEQNLAHGDLDAEKVVLGPGGQVKVVDLGLGDDEGAEEGSPTYDTRTDVYRLGAILYEMATGRPPEATGPPPVSGDAEVGGAEAHSAKATIPPSMSNPDIPAELDRIIAACLEPDPEDRYQHAGQLAIDLGKLRRRTETASVVMPTGEMAAQRRTGRRLGLAVLWSAATLALVVALGLATWKWIVPIIKPGPPFKPDDRILVADFENATDDADLGLALRDSLENDLPSLVRLKTIPRIMTTDVTAVYGPAAEARCLLGECEGYLTGRLSGDAKAYTLTIAIYRAGRAKPVFEASARADESEFLKPLLSLYDELERDMRRRWNLGAARQVTCNDDLSGSVNGLKAWHAWLLSSRRTGADRLALLNRAVDLDPNCALCQFFLGFHHPDRLEGLSHMKEALRLGAAAAKGHPECRENALVYEIHYFERTWDYDAEMERLNRCVQLFPNSTECRMMYAIVSYRILDDLALTERVERMVYEKEGSPFVFNFLTDVLLSLKKLDDADALIADLRRRAQGSEAEREASIARFEFGRAKVRGDEPMAILRMIDGFVTAGRISREDARGWRVEMLLAAGRLAEAESLLREEAKAGITEAARSGQTGRGEKRDYGPLDWLEQRRTGKVRTLTADEADGYRGHLMEVLTLTKWSVRLDQAHPLAEVLETVVEEHKDIANQRVLDVFQYARGGLALLERRPTEAVRLLEPLAREYRVGSTISPHGVLARAYEAAGRWADAARTYETLLEEGVAGRRLYQPVIILWQHRLAGIYERLGNTERTRHWYGRFLNDWRNADPGTPEVEDAKRRLAALGGPLPAGT